MKKAFIVLILLALMAACKNGPTPVQSSIPAAPVSIPAAAAALHTKKFVVSDVGTIDHWNNNEFHWDSGSGDTSKFYRDFINGQKSFSLQFVNDTMLSLQEDKKLIEGHYSFEKDTSSALLLKVSYTDTSFAFNPGEPMVMTYTYKLRGIDDNNLLLETPREINNNKVVVLMKKL